MSNILRQADICDARETLAREPKPDVIALTPNEFRSLGIAFHKLEEQIKLFDTALDIAAEDIDFDVLGTCPNEFEDYGCPFGECKFADGKPHENDCWKKAFIKAAEKHLRVNNDQSEECRKGDGGVPGAGEVSEMTHKFVWYKEGLYEHWHGRRCRIIVSRKRKAIIEFENGERTVTLLNALRRLNNGA